MVKCFRKFKVCSSDNFYIDLQFQNKLWALKILLLYILQNWFKSVVFKLSITLNKKIILYFILY